MEEYYSTDEEYHQDEDYHQDEFSEDEGKLIVK